MTVGDRIKNRRIELGITQDELALRLGFASRSSINKIEVNAQNLPQSKIKKIAEILKVSPAYLMGWEEKKQETFSEFEKELISKYRAADNITQEIVKRALELDKAFKKDEVQSY